MAPCVGWRMSRRRRTRRHSRHRHHRSCRALPSQAGCASCSDTGVTSTGACIGTGCATVRPTACRALDMSQGGSGVWGTQATAACPCAGPMRSLGFNVCHWHTCCPALPHRLCSSPAWPWSTACWDSLTGCASAPRHACGRARGSMLQHSTPLHVCTRQQRKHAMLA